MKILKFLLVGVGNRGMWAVRRVSQNAAMTVVALVDKNRDFLETAAGVCGVAEEGWYDDLETALKGTDADAVIICTPTITHKPFSELCFKYGKHVLVEKAMTHDYADAEELVQKADQAGVRFCVSQNYSWMRHNVAVRKILDNPEHPYHPGNVALMDIYCYRFRPEPRTMTYPWAMVWDMTCHHFDILSYWFDAPISVTNARSFNPEWSHYPYDANINADILIDGKIYGNYLLYHSSTLAETRLILQGDRGVLEVNNLREVLFYPRPTLQLQGSEPVKVDLDEGISLDGTYELLEGFYQYVVGGDEPRSSGRNNLRVLALCRDLIAKAKASSQSATSRGAAPVLERALG